MMKINLAFSAFEYRKFTPQSPEAKTLRRTKMKNASTLLFLLVLNATWLFSQEFKRNNVWPIGFNPVAILDFNNLNFTIDSLQFPALSTGNAAVSDLNGDLQFFTSGFVILNSNGELMNDGLDINCPSGIMLSNFYSHRSPFPQTSIILPKKENQYYVFSTGMSDSVANNYLNHSWSEFDVLSFCVVDMDSNNGQGKVIEKNRILSEHQHYVNCAMSAVKHSNGKDWWLAKGRLFTESISRIFG